MKRFVFDLDNTLIYTDLLNNGSYNYALKEFGLGIINDSRRITRNIVFEKYANLDDDQKNQIIELKQYYFVNSLYATIPNINLLNLLRFQKIEHCILWTSADKIRVNAILNYYGICKSFKEIIFSDKINVLEDMEIICKTFECKLEQITFYEDNKRVVKELKILKANLPDGVRKKFIVKVGKKVKLIKMIANIINSEAKKLIILPGKLFLKKLPINKIQYVICNK